MKGLWTGTLDMLAAGRWDYNAGKPSPSGPRNVNFPCFTLSKRFFGRNAQSAHPSNATASGEMGYVYAESCLWGLGFGDGDDSESKAGCTLSSRRFQ